MSTFIIPEPPKEISRDDFETEAEFRAAWRLTYPRYIDYQFRYVWLPAAISAAEYARVQQLPIALLAEMYETIAAEGPGGITWYRQLRGMLDIFDSNGSSLFIEEMGNLYKTLMRELESAVDVNGEMVWAIYREHMVDVWRGNNVDIDLPELDYDPVRAVLHNRVWRAPGVTYWAETVLERFSQITLGRDVLITYPEPYPTVVAAHDAFIAKWHIEDRARNL